MQFLSFIIELVLLSVYIIDIYLEGFLKSNDVRKIISIVEFEKSNFLNWISLKGYLNRLKSSKTKLKQFRKIKKNE